MSNYKLISIILISVILGYIHYVFLVTYLFFKKEEKLFNKIGEENGLCFTETYQKETTKRILNNNDDSFMLNGVRFYKTWCKDNDKFTLAIKNDYSDTYNHIFMLNSHNMLVPFYYRNCSLEDKCNNRIRRKLSRKYKTVINNFVEINTN